MSHPFPQWWEIMMTRRTGAQDGLFVHPVCERDIMIGNGTIGLELAEDWPELDTVVVPFGGGGLICGIALALRALGKAVRVVACEVETSTPLAAARKAGRLIAEGAGAAALAAALSGRISGRNVAAVISGGNIDFRTLIPLLLGQEGSRSGEGRPA